MPDSDPPFDVMRLEAVAARVRDRLGQRRADAPAYTVIFGAGFSHPLIPLASRMVQDVPWWLHWSGGEDAAGGAFPERPTPGDPAAAALQEFEREFWRRIAESPERPPQLALDAATGTPDVAKHDAIFAAYQALMAPDLPGVLCDPGLRRDYMCAAIGRVGGRVNRAHAFLASILGEQQSPEWRKRFRRPFCRTVFTTNFDPLLQRSLQLVQTLYFMSDRPETLEPPRDDDHPAIHLLYTHGSVHRHVLLNTAEEIGRAETRNASALANYLKHKGVIVIGYSGWRDTVMSALRACEAFDGNLYWINVPPPATAAKALSREVVEFLASRKGNAFYVQATADEAMAALHSELGLGEAPRFVLDPLGPVRAALDDVVLPEGASAAAAGGQKGQQVLASMQARLAGTRERLKLAHEVFLDPSVVEAAQAQAAKDRATAAAAMSDADRAWFAKDAPKALELWRSVAESPAALDPDTRTRAWQNSGVALLSMGDAEAAERAYDAGAAVPGAGPEALFHLLTARGYLHEREKRMARAEADYRGALTIAQSVRNVEWEVSTLNDLAGVLMEDETRLDEAALLFRGAIEWPDAPLFQRMRATNNLGVIEYKRKNLEEMRRMFEEAHRLDPDSPYPPVNLALMLLLEGRAPEALAAYDAALPKMDDADFLRRAVADLDEAKGRFDLDADAVAQAQQRLAARALELGG